MRTFFTILFVGFVVNVRASHPCDRFAANTHQKPAGSNEEDDQVIDLDLFSAAKTGVTFITNASTSSLSGSSTICTGRTHGDKCEAVMCSRNVLKSPPSGSANGIKDLLVDLVSVGVSGETRKAVKLNMTVRGADVDDYIFEHVPGTPITAMEYTEGVTKGESIDIDPALIPIIKSPFALYRNKPGAFSLYITCDGESMWVSYPKDAVDANKQSETAEELETYVQKLQAIAYDEKKTNPTLIPVTTSIIPQFSNLILAGA